MGLIIAFLCFDTTSEAARDFAIGLFVALLVETFLLGIILFLGWYSVSHNESYTKIIAEEDEKKLKCNYMILIITAILRFGNNLWFIIQNW